MTTETTFGVWLRQQRRQLDWTQVELAQRVGYSVATIRKLERDELRPSKHLAELLAQALDVAVTQHASLVNFARAAPTPPLEPVAQLPHEHRRSNLPAQLTPFFGRTAEIVELTQALTNPTARLITIVGPGGMGKTRLALEVAQSILGVSSQTDSADNLKSKIQNLSWQDPKYADGVYFVALASLRAPEHIVPAIAEAITLRFQVGNRLPKQQLLDYLRHKQLLLVLDNFEHLAAGTELILELLQECPALRLLVTSREHLQLNSETIFVLESLTLPAAVTLPDVLSYSAVQLFVETACRLRPKFILTPANAQAVVRICQLVGAMPLGIILAAGWVDVLPVAAIADEIQKSIDFLESNLQDLPPRQRSMRATFDSSWQLLLPAQQAALAQLSVFRGSFDRQAAGEVAGASLRTLAALVAKSLLQVRSSQERYDVHELVKQYGIAKLQVAPEVWTATHLRHCCYYAAFLCQQMDSADAKPPLHEVEQVFADIQMAWHYSVENQQLAQIQQLADGFLVYYRLYSWYRAGAGALALYQQALTCFDLATQATDQRTALSCLYESIGELHELNSDHKDAFADLERALECTSDTDTIRRGRLYGKIANVLVSMNRYEQGDEYYTHAEAILTQTPHRDAIWWDEWLRIAMRRMGLYYVQNRQDDAAELGRQLRPLLDQHGSVTQRMQFLLSLGLMVLRQARYFNSSEAIAHTGESLAFSLELGNLSDIAYGHFNHGFCHLWSNHLDKAEIHIQIARTMAEESGDIQLLARTMTYLTFVYRKRKDSKRVQQLATDSLRIAGEAKMLHYAGMARAHYAWLAWRAGDLVETKRQAAAANEDWSRLEQAQSMVIFRWLALFPLIGVALQEKNIADALQCAQQIIQPHQQRLPDELTALLERAITVGDDERTDAAPDLLRQAFQLAQALHYV